MPFSPRLPNEVRQTMVARQVATSKLTDVAEGGVLGTLLGNVAEEISAVERRYQDFVDGHFLDGVYGADLDDRVAQLPPEFPRRRAASFASGGNPLLQRETGTGAITIEAGGILVGRSDSPSLQYTNEEAFTIADGQTIYPDVGDPEVRLLCTTPGISGNAGEGVIDTILQAPADVISVTNTEAVGGAHDAESDADLRSRAWLWMSSLSKCQPGALERFALNFEGSDSSRIIHAKAWEDPDIPGYTELVVDDGYGMVSFKRAAVATTGTVPTLAAGTRYTFYFDSPAVPGSTTPGDTSAVITLYITPSGGGATVAYPSPNADYLPVEERGVLWTARTLSSLAISPGDTWEIKGHRVYTGVMAELQVAIEDRYRAAGTRVRVVAPERQLLTLTGTVAVKSGYEPAAVIAAVQREVIAFCVNLAPGEPIYMFRLYDALSAVPGLVNIIFDQGDKYPASPRHKIYTNVANVRLS